MEMGKAVATVAGIVLVIGSVQIVEFIRSGADIEDAQTISDLGAIEAPAPALTAMSEEAIARRFFA